MKTAGCRVCAPAVLACDTSGSSRRPDHRCGLAAVANRTDSDQSFVDRPIPPFRAAYGGRLVLYRLTTNSQAVNYFFFILTTSEKAG